MGDGQLWSVLRIAEEFAKVVSVEFAGALLRPHASWMRKSPEKGEKVLEAARRAGYELVKEGRMSAEVLGSIHQPLLSEEERRQWYDKTHE